MRLVRYLLLLIVVLSTTAWAAPTQAELPGAWSHAALSLGALSAQHLQMRLGCDPAQCPTADPASDGLASQTDRTACLPLQMCLGARARGNGPT